MMRTICSIIMCLGLFTVSAQEKLVFNTLEETVNYAVENNNNLEVAQIDQEIIQAQIAEVKGRALPQVNGSAGFTDNFSLQEQQLPGEIFGGEPGRCGFR